MFELGSNASGDDEHVVDTLKKEKAFDYIAQQEKQGYDLSQAPPAATSILNDIIYREKLKSEESPMPEVEDRDNIPSAPKLGGKTA